jgi:hypothetical protein
MSVSRGWVSCQSSPATGIFERLSIITDRNLFALNVNYYGNDWTETEQMLAWAPLAHIPMAWELPSGHNRRPLERLSIALLPLGLGALP